MTAPAVPRGLLGMAAESYERFRLGYPDDVVDRTLAFAGSPVTHALEVGAGRARPPVPSPVAASPSRRSSRTRTSTRSWNARRRAWRSPHSGAPSRRTTDRRPAWSTPPGPFPGPTRPPAGHTQPHLLQGHGVLALFDNRVRVKDPDTEAAITQVLVGREGDARTTDSHGVRGRGRHVEELEASGLFAAVRHHRVERELTLTQQEYVGYVTTRSAFLELPWPRRQRVLARAFAVLPEQVVVDASVDLDLARRV